MSEPRNATFIKTGEEFETDKFIDEKRVYGRIYVCTSILDNANQEIDLGFTRNDVTIWKILRSD